MEEEAITHGALDIEANTEDIFTFFTSTEDLNQVARSLEGSGHDLVDVSFFDLKSLTLI